MIAYVIGIVIVGLIKVLCDLLWEPSPWGIRQLQREWERGEK